MRKKAATPPVADGKWRLDDDDNRSSRLPQSSPSSDWLNHATGGPATRDIFTHQRHDRKRDKKRGLARFAAGAALLAGRGLVRAGRFGYRQLQPMRLRDWITAAALLAVLVAMGAYMKFDDQAVSPFAREGCRWHTVAVGDTLLSLARGSGVS